MLQDLIHKAIQKAVLAYDTDDEPLIKFSVEATKELSHGDFATNAALILAKKKSRPALEIAQELANKISSDDSVRDIIDKVQAVEPGFVNFYLSENYLAKNLNISKPELADPKTVLIEYSSPNIAKSFSVGNFRSTLIGQALVNIYSYLGYKTIGENHLGDWGTQFGMILAAVKRNDVDINNLTLSELESLYVQFNSDSKDDPILREDAKKWFKKLEQGDKEAREIWKKAVEISQVEFEKVYNTLNVHIDNAHGESFYEDKMQDIIDEVKASGLSRTSDGAQIVEFDDMPPAMLVKSDGTTTYYTRDIAAVRYRLDTFNPDVFVYEVGAEQSLHFKQVFKTVELLGWAKEKQFIHVAHGLVLMEGKKMSTRLGTNIKVEDVLNQAIQKAKELSDSKDDNLAKQVGIGAVKYFDLSHHPASNINFDWDLVLSLEGNSGPYLQYTNARINSLLEKSFQESLDSAKLIFDESEKNLMRKIVRFNGVVLKSAQMYSPNILTEYLYDLSQEFNSFYNAQKIIGSSNEESRLLVAKATGEVLKQGLNLLGIDSPDRM